MCATLTASGISEIDGYLSELEGSADIRSETSPTRRLRNTVLTLDRYSVQLRVGNRETLRKENGSLSFVVYNPLMQPV